MEAHAATPILLIAADGRELALLAEYLPDHGFRPVMTTPEEAPGVLAGGHYGAMLLEIRLSGPAWLGLLERLRSESPVPVLALAESREAAEHLSTLDLGASAYLASDCAPHELLAVLRRVVRMGEPAAAGHRLVRVRELLLDVDTRRVLLGAQAIRLSPAEFALLLTLASEPGRLYGREELAAVMKVNVPAVDVHVAAVRRKLGDDARRPQWIATVRGAGYRLPVAALRATSSR